MSTDNPTYPSDCIVGPCPDGECDSRPPIGYTFTARLTRSCNGNRYHAEATATSMISFLDAQTKAYKAALNQLMVKVGDNCFPDPYFSPKAQELGGGEYSKRCRTHQSKGIGVVLVTHDPYLKFLSGVMTAINFQSQQFIRKVLVFDTPLANQIPRLSNLPKEWEVLEGDFRNPNLARNAGFEMLQDQVEWICFWDGDNKMPYQHAEHGFNAISLTRENVAVLYPDVQQVSENGSSFNLIKQPEWSYLSAQHRSLCDTGSFWRVAALQEVNGFCDKQTRYDDYDLALRIFHCGWRGQKLNARIEHTLHGENRSLVNEASESLFNAWSFAFVTLWSGVSQKAGDIVEWYIKSDIPPNSSIYWIDNSGHKEMPLILSDAIQYLNGRFKSITIIDGGEPYNRQTGEAYLTLKKHKHVAHLYNKVLPRIREEMVVLIEDDTLPPLDGVRTLAAQFEPFGNVGMVAGVYRSRFNPHVACISMDKEIWNECPPFDTLPSEPFEVGMTGGGFAMIANWALQQSLPMQCNETHDGRLMGWDGNLGLSLTRMGYKILAHPKVKCEHLCPEVIQYLQSRSPQSSD